SAMELIAARARKDRNLPSRCAPKFGCIRRCLNSEFLHRVQRHQTIGAAQCTKRTKSAAKSVPWARSRADPNIRANAIHHPVVGTGALSVHAELSAVRW